MEKERGIVCCGGGDGQTDGRKRRMGGFCRVVPFWSLVRQKEKKRLGQNKLEMPTFFDEYFFLSSLLALRSPNNLL